MMRLEPTDIVYHPSKLDTPTKKIGMTKVSTDRLRVILQDHLDDCILGIKNGCLACYVINQKFGVLLGDKEVKP